MYRYFFTLTLFCS